jgi:hypothetical protein
MHSFAPYLIFQSTVWPYGFFSILNSTMFLVTLDILSHPIPNIIVGYTTRKELASLGTHSK